MAALREQLAEARTTASTAAARAQQLDETASRVGFMTRYRTCSLRGLHGDASTRSYVAGIPATTTTTIQVVCLLFGLAWSLKVLVLPTSNCNGMRHAYMQVADEHSKQVALEAQRLAEGQQAVQAREQQLRQREAELADTDRRLAVGRAQAGLGPFGWRACMYCLSVHAPCCGGLRLQTAY